MKDLPTTFNPQLSDPAGQDWLQQIDDIAEEHGYAEPLGPDHTALFIDDGTTLLVTFETIGSARQAHQENMPLGWSFVKSDGWSSLTILAHQDNDWFRGAAIYGYFDRLIDDGFFDDFDRVLFYGANAGGYAAAAYSVACPDAQVLLVQPQATLDRSRAAWDRRFPSARRQDFTTRFGYAPMMVETARQVWVIHDPELTEDAMHASLFDRPNIGHLTCTHLGEDIGRHLSQMGILPDLMKQAASGELTRDSFATLWRTRRSHLPYLRSLFRRLSVDDRLKPRLKTLCRIVSSQGYRPLFRKRLAQLEAEKTAKAEEPA